MNAVAEGKAGAKHDLMDKTVGKRRTNFFKQTNTLMYRFVDEKVSVVVCAPSPTVYAAAV